MSHHWGNNIITIQGNNTIKTIFVTKKLGAPTKHPRILICYDFHFKIFEKEDFMFATKPRLFSIGTIVVLTSIWSNQSLKLITITGLNLVDQVIKHVEHVSKQLISSNIPIKLVPIRHVKMVILLDTFQQHLLKTFF